MDLGNPIKKINNVNVSFCPSSFKQLKSDVSAADSGRTEDGLMWKKKIGTATKNEIEIQCLPSDLLHTILNMIDDEYMTIEYIDMREGVASSGYVVSHTFYCGDVSYDLYNATLDIWKSLKFNVIQRDLT